MLIVHHLNNSRSQRVLWLLEELALLYEIVRYERDRKTMLAPPELKAVHPLGKSPVLQDATPEGGGLVLAETGAIVEYVVERHGGGRLKPPADSADWPRWLHFMHYAEGSAMSPLLLKLVLTRMGILGKPAMGFVNRQLDTHLGYLESVLLDRQWFAGDAFSAADIMMSFPLEAASSRAGLTAASHPRLWDFIQRIHAREAYQRALAKGGPYAYA